MRANFAQCTNIKRIDAPLPAETSPVRGRSTDFKPSGNCRDGSIGIVSFLLGKLDGKVALVTGASQGIGKGISLALASEGCGLVLTARTQSTLEAAVNEVSGLGGQVVGQPADVAEPEQVEALFKLATDRFQRLDLLVNNAGVSDGGPLEQMSVEIWDRVIATNLRGPFLCTRAAMCMMKRQGGGRIINIGSIASQRVRPNSAPYAASKHGLWGLTQVTALEGRGHGITCGCLHPGNTLVERRRDNTSDPIGDEPQISTEDIAQVVLLMATLPPQTQMLESVVLPSEQLFVGRG